MEHPVTFEKSRYSVRTLVRLTDDPGTLQANRQRGRYAVVTYRPAPFVVEGTGTYVQFVNVESQTNDKAKAERAAKRSGEKLEHVGAFAFVLDQGEMV